MPDDPRKLGGGIAGGNGNPYARNNVVIDTTNALLFDHLGVAMFTDREGQPLAAVEFAGRINKTNERVDLLLVANGDGLASIVSEIVGLCSREGGQLAAEFQVALEERMKQVPTRDGES